VFDYDSDYISDLLVVDEVGNRTIYRFTSDRSADYEVIHLESELDDQLMKAHSSGHLDLNSDGLPDLILTTQSGLEIYERQKRAPLFKFHNHVSWPSNVTSGKSYNNH
jgi:hypothetical protein